MDLNVTITGEAGPLPPVLLAHGLFGTGRNLGGIARRLEDRQRLQVDMRNHGDSPWSGEHGYPELAGDLARVIAAHGGVADVVGHSMGGKAAMALALLHPQAVRRLVVLDIAPIAYGHSQTDLIDRMQAMALAGLERRSQADARLADAGVQDAGTRAFLLQSLEVRAGQPARWRMNLDVLRDSMDALTGWPGDGPTPGAFGGPVLALYGGASDYVTEAGRAAFARWFPQAELRCLPDAGHWLHADRPVETAEAVAAFLS